MRGSYWKGQNLNVQSIKKLIKREFQTTNMQTREKFLIPWNRSTNSQSKHILNFEFLKQQKFEASSRNS